MKGFRAYLWVFVFGCSHRNVGWPITLGDRTYRVCCNCGVEFDYSWDTMSYVHRRASGLRLANAMTRSSHSPTVLRQAARGS
jgi:hypothetical protein